MHSKARILLCKTYKVCGTCTSYVDDVVLVVAMAGKARAFSVCIHLSGKLWVPLWADGVAGIGINSVSLYVWENR